MAPPEPLVSKMRVNHAMVLNVLDQWEGQQAALNTLLLDNHEEPARRDALVERAVQVLPRLLPDVVADEGDLGPIGELLAAAGHLTPTPAARTRPGRRSGTR